uniref:Cytosolic protein n=1 Tax=Strongyloides venezuelensis TaxID=75913 RepID=A0A0K0F5Z3_STRVS
MKFVISLTMKNSEESSVKGVENEQKSTVITEEFLKKEGVLLRDGRNASNVDKIIKIKNALRKSMSLNITPDAHDDKTNELKSKVLGYMKSNSNRIEVTSDSLNGNYVRSMSMKYEDNLKNNKVLSECTDIKKCKTKNEKLSQLPRQCNLGMNVSDKIPDVGGLRNYYRYMGYTDINKTVKVVSELKASFNDGNKPLDS